MSKKIMSKQELTTIKKKLEARKKELEALKKAGGDKWNDTLQQELDNAVMTIVDIDEELETAPDEKDIYKPEAGTEGLIHLEIVKGAKFSPTTGKLISKPYVQLFSRSEWDLFKNNFAALGYTISKVLHDPFTDGEAQKLVAKSNE